MEKERPHFTGEQEKELEDLLSLCNAHLKKYNAKAIRKAFLVCIDAHKNQNRKNGDPYYKHPLSVAEIVIREFRLDDVSVICALLHDTLDSDNGYEADSLKQEFGPVVAEIVEGVSKIKNVEMQHLDNKADLENFRKILFSLFTDIRIILIKLAERLDNLKSLHFLPEDKQQAIAKETVEIYVAFANRFGLRNIKWEMEDLAFKYLNKEAYSEIKLKLSETRKEREEYVKNFESPVNKRLSEDKFLKANNVKFELSGRAKHIYSIYNKQFARGIPMEEFNDLFAIRVILETDDPFICFYTYGIIADTYPPVPNTFKDYISAPKSNGYRSIHVAVLGPKNRPVEVQIRTRNMHDISENGLAAHFKYKSGLIPAQSLWNNSNIQAWMNSVREFFESDSQESPEILLDTLKKNLLLKEIHVFTPKNRLITLPKDATPLDFAFGIHTDIGYKCIGAKVNGKIVPLNFKLQSGDQVEILTSKKETVEPDWLVSTITVRAKSAINKYLKADHKKKIKEGESLIREIAGENEIELKNGLLPEGFIASLKYTDKETFFYDLAMKKIESSVVSDLLASFTRKPGTRGRKKSLKTLIAESEEKFSQVRIFGEYSPGTFNMLTQSVLNIPGLNIYGIRINKNELDFEVYMKLSYRRRDKIDKFLVEARAIATISSVEELA